MASIPRACPQENSRLLRRSALLATTIALATLITAMANPTVSFADDGLDLGRPDPVPAAAIESSATGRVDTVVSDRPRTTSRSDTASGYVQLVPTRLLDTRTDTPLIRDTARSVAIAGRSDVSSAATAAALNVTVVDAAQSGYLTVTPCGAPVGTSSLNFSKGQTIANLAVVDLGTGGAICVIPSVSGLDVLVDLSGYVELGGALFTPVTPTRLIDTRASAPVQPTAPLTVLVAGRAGVPPEATSVAVTVTIADPASSGYATVYACGGGAPNASNVNFARGQGAAANSAVVGLDPAGAFCVISSTRSNVIVDITGWFGATGTEVHPDAPIRLVDTRQSSRRLAASSTPLEVEAAPGALGAVVNITAAGSAAAGYLTVWSCDGPKPATSSLNFTAGQTIANAVLAPVSTTGTICIATSTPTHVIVDRTAVLGLAGTGALTPPSTPTTPSSPGTGTGGSTGNVIVDWALGQAGAPYAAINPYRFGDSRYGKAWDCAADLTSCSKQGWAEPTDDLAAGSYAYDCSGLVVAAYLRDGIDLVKQGASYTDAMLTTLPRVPTGEVRVGDLVMSDHNPDDSDPVDHVGLYISPTEMVHAGTCKGGTSGVCRTKITWSRVVAVLRPTSE